MRTKFHNIGASARSYSARSAQLVRRVVRELETEGFPWFSASAIVAALVVALTFRPSANYPDNAATANALVTIESLQDQVAVSVFYLASGRDLRSAGLRAEVEKSTSGSLGIMVDGGVPNLFEVCESGTEVLSLETHEGYISYWARAEVGASISVSCTFNEGRVLNADGALTQYALPSFSTHPNGCIEETVIGVPGVASQRSCAENSADSRVIDGWSILSSDPLAQSRETTRAMYFGIAVGAGVAFFANVVNWLELYFRSQRMVRRPRRLPAIRG